VFFVFLFPTLHHFPKKSGFLAAATLVVWLRLKVVVDRCDVWVAIFGSFGDVACHVISVGTCCPNLHCVLWTDSSAVKHDLYCDREGRAFESAKSQLFFAPN
jgi:hypothetical protein